MANNRFRENKFLNESGSKTGNWYMNRLDYFQFYTYPKYNKHKYLALTGGVLFLYIALKVLSNTILGAIPFLYVSYVALLSFYILRLKTCRYRGYLFYPKRFINFYKDREVGVDLNDFDSVATMQKSRNGILR